MKKIIFFLFAGLCSCTQNQDVPNVSDDVVKTVEVKVSPIEYDINSRMNVTPNLDYLWELNDTIGIFPNKGGQVEFPITAESVGTTTAKFNGGGWGLKSGYKYSAYYPFNFYNRDATEIPFTYEGQVQVGSDSRNHLSRFSLLMSTPSEVVNGGLTFQMNNVGALLLLTLTMPEAKKYTSLDLYADSEIIPVNKTYNILSDELPEKVNAYRNRLHVDLQDISTVSANQDIVLWVAFPVMSQAEKTLKAVVKDSQGYTYVGDIYRSNGNPFYLNLSRNKGYRLKASPVLTDGVSAGIEDWEIGEEILGSAN